MSFEEAEVLRERAEDFLRVAERLVEEGTYDLAAFHVEQYCQLYLKYKLLVKTGTYPRTHSLARLVKALLEMAPGLKPLLDLPENAIQLARIEDAYIGARYLPRRYFKAEIETMLYFVREVFKPLVEGV